MFNSNTCSRMRLDTYGNPTQQQNNTPQHTATTKRQRTSLLQHLHTKRTPPSLLFFSLPPPARPPARSAQHFSPHSKRGMQRPTPFFLWGKKNTIQPLTANVTLEIFSKHEEPLLGIKNTAEEPQRQLCRRASPHSPYTGRLRRGPPTRLTNRTDSSWNFYKAGSNGGGRG